MHDTHGKCPDEHLTVYNIKVDSFNNKHQIKLNYTNQWEKPKILFVISFVPENTMRLFG